METKTLIQNLHKCEHCGDSPSIELWWANGREQSYFCSEHFNDFIQGSEVAPTRALSKGELFWSLNGQEDPLDDLQTVFAKRGGQGSGNFGHAGRPGKVGGSAPSGGGGFGEFSSSEARNDEEKQLQDFVRQFSDLRKGAMSGRFKDFKFSSMEEMVLELGRFYQPPDDDTLPMGCEVGVARECFSNAFEVALERGDNELVYTEGMATTDIMFPMAHAWLTTPDGKVVDPTWLDRGVAYYGIPMDTSWVSKQIVKSGYYGVLPSTREIFENGIPSDAIVERGGAGSGHFGHAGRPGKVGGSAPDGRGSSETQIVFPKGTSRLDAGLEATRQRDLGEKFVAVIKNNKGEWVVVFSQEDAIDVWAERQSERDIEELIVLGETGVISSFVGDENSVGITSGDAEFIAEHKDLVMMHNHPSRPGAPVPPSFRDFQIMAQRETGGLETWSALGTKMVVVNSDGRYVVNFRNEFNRVDLNNIASEWNRFTRENSGGVIISGVLPVTAQEEYNTNFEYASAVSEYQLERLEFIAERTELFEIEWKSR